MLLYRVADMHANIYTRAIHHSIGALSKYHNMEHSLLERVPSLKEVNQGSTGDSGRVNIGVRVIEIMVGSSCIPKFL